MSKRYETLQTVVPHDNTHASGYARTTKLDQRAEELNSWARRGYEMRHTRTFTLDDTEVYIDDLAKDPDAPF